MDEIKALLQQEFEKAADKVAFINEVKGVLFELSPNRANPVDFVQWVPIEKVQANNYNPNAVAKQEMNLLYTSIREDGYTQPVVCFRDEEKDKYIIVDGFHRNMIVRMYRDIYERCGGRLPVVVISKNLADRMASTVRHNRARGKHSLDGMTNIIYKMIKEGNSDMEICNKLGMEELELVKLKHITGFAKIFKNYEYSKAIENLNYHHDVVQKTQ